MRSHTNKGRSRVWKRKQLIKKCWQGMVIDFQGWGCMENHIRVSWRLPGRQGELCWGFVLEAPRGDGIWKGLMTETGFILFYSFNWWQKVPTTTVKGETVREGIFVEMSTTEREAWALSRYSVDNLSSPPDAVGWWYTSTWWLWAEIHNFTSLGAASLSIVESD